VATFPGIVTGDNAISNQLWGWQNNGTTSPHTSQPTRSPRSAADISQALLNKTLLPAESLGPRAVANYFNTDLSKVTGICGAAPPDGAELTAGKILLDSPNGDIFSEGITAWGSAKEAAQAISNDISSVGQSGCSISNNGNTEQYNGIFPGPAPQGCTKGAYLATDATFGSYTGFHVEVACGIFTIGVESVASLPAIGSAPGSEDAANGYLNNIVGRLMTALQAK
jgi:hypothetical protein